MTGTSKGEKKTHKRWSLVRNFQNCGNPQCSMCFSDGEKLDERPHGPYYYLSRRGSNGRSEVVYVGSRITARGIDVWIDNVNSDKELTAVPRPDNLGKLVREKLGEYREIAAAN